MKTKQKNKTFYFIDSLVTIVITDIKNKIYQLINSKKQGNNK